MSKLKNLSGQEIISIFHSFGFAVVKQKGSHVKLRREVDGMRQTLTILNHKELDKGTAKAIMEQASQYIQKEDLREYFYTN